MSGERDPRLAELEFLSYMARNGNVNVTDKSYLEATYAGVGLGLVPWEDMIHHLLVEGFVQNRSYIGFLPTDNKIDHPDKFTSSALTKFHQGSQITIGLTHKGRKHLWDLIDQFAAARRLHSLGVIYAKEGCAADFEIAQARRPADQAIAVIAFDVDHFKPINDTLGHSAGDEVLRRIFTSAKNTIGRSGNVYSYGGDEVTIIVHSTTEDEAKKLAEQVRTSVQDEFTGKGKLDKVEKQPTVSVGVLVLKRRATFKEAYEAVDALAYKSKQAGRNNCHVDVWS
jgi:diguanylate cyclase (GGDEF)-like protein